MARWLLALAAAVSALRPPCASRAGARRAVARASTPDDAPPVVEASADVTVAEPGAVTDVALDKERIDATLSERQKEIARLRAAETFMEKDTGQYICKVCEYTFDPEEGAKGVAAGTEFCDIQSNWRCPRCRASKDSFAPVTITIAGFAENQDYGLGGNSMTEEQKTLYIFGALGAFFVLFLSGYLMT